MEIGKKEGVWVRNIIAAVLAIIFLILLSYLLIYQISWQGYFSAVMTWMQTFVGSTFYSIIMFHFIIMLAVFILPVVDSVAPSTNIFLWFRLLVYLLKEFLLIFFLSLAAFFDSIAIFGEGMIKEHTLFYISILTFVLTGVFYYSVKYIYRKQAQRFSRNPKRYKESSMKKIYNDARNMEKQLFATFDINALLYVFVTFTTVVILADAYATSAWGMIREELHIQAPSTIDDFINSRIFLLLIPAFSIYVLSIYAVLRNGLKLRN
ncbi:hypothetical protein DV702_03640 [Sporosarcina sp. PTS2304]|uniref:hypothetical protein n=1 Tax=Sporosarcina sp. PTS2304 TaxID=2283194 RepID=UPI000E0E009E|nr:hypothetical protein [Sporosarcina sp. PTS2304]AXH98899.1 hypothetical protein DV702_03640 [Sporosarcina sp. PTS2304]